MERFARHRCQRSGDAGRGLDEFLQTNDRPTLIWVNSHIGYGSPHKQDTKPPTANPWVKKKLSWSRSFTAGRKTQSSWCRTEYYENFRDGIGKRGGELRKKWEDCSLNMERNFPNSRIRSNQYAAPQASRWMGQELTHVSRRRQGHRHSRKLGQSSERGSPEYALDGRRFGRPGRFRSDPAQVRRCRRLSRPAAMAAATCTSAYANTGWPRH